MSHLRRSVFVMCLLFALSLRTALGRCAEPKTGFIETVRYTVNVKGEPYGQKRVTRVWFDARHIRTEEQIGDDTTWVNVEGEHGWYAYPAAQRIVSPTVFAASQVFQAAKPVPAYSATVRNVFARVYAAQARVGTETIHDLPAWKYAWHTPARWSGDVGSGAQEGVVWILADADFPLVLQNDTLANGRVTSRIELLRLERGLPIAPALFEPPRGYKPILLPTLPESGFRLELKTTRLSRAYGWQIQAKDVYLGQSAQVIHQHSGTTREANGRETSFNPPDETLTWASGKIEFLREVQTPYWGVMKKVGTERILNLEADIVESVAEGVSEKFWIVNHPLFGTISLRRESPMSGDRAITRVLALEANSVLKR